MVLPGPVQSLGLPASGCLSRRLCLCQRPEEIAKNTGHEIRFGVHPDQVQRPLWLEGTQVVTTGYERTYDSSVDAL